MMTKFEIKNKRDGHNKAANMIEKRAKKAGKDSSEYALYLHHLEQYCVYSDMLKGA